MKTSPAVVSKINNILYVLKKHDPSLVQKEGNHAMIESATFGDDIKAKGGSYQDEWHFTDEPIFDDDYPRDQMKVELNPHNATFVIPELISILKKQGDYQNSYTYQQIATHKFFPEQNSLDVESIALRLLIHYVGDLHQPLHTASRYDAKFKKGDMGGNFFALQEQGGAKNLHSAWDSVLYEFTGWEKSPLSDADWVDQGKTAAALVARHKRDTSNVGQLIREKLYNQNLIQDVRFDDLDPKSWVQENSAILYDFLYKGVDQYRSKALSSAYVDQGRDIAEKQLVIAGFRLAKILKDIYEPNTVLQNLTVRPLVAVPVLFLI